MKERSEEVHRHSLIAISFTSFLVLLSVIVFNAYRIQVLRNEVNELRESVSRCKQCKEDDSQYITRERRDISENHPNNRLKHDLAIPRINNTKHSRHIVKKSAYMSSESSGYSSRSSFDSEFPLLQDEEVVTKRSRSRMQVLDERHPRTGRIKPLPSIHMNGDTSAYVLGTHDNFNGNGHLRHPHRVFVDWKPSSWVHRTGMMSHFEFDSGYLTIKEPGIYFVYAQVYYLDEHDSNGYRVLKNNEMILQCTVQTHSGIRIQKGNTCYTAGVEYFAENDRISLEDLIGNHYTLFEEGRSFFGVVKLGDVRVRT